ncbi:MAG: DNA methyltransferase [Planctomycetes bacterium]|nr:DNA methyltransferase [Planctomycetota bacterium]
MANPKSVYNDLDLSNWKEYDNILTDSLWMIPRRDKGAGHKLEYHGNFVPQIAEQLILRFTKEDDVIIDPFLGAGTTAIEALEHRRRTIGIELKDDLAEQVRSRLRSLGADKDDARIITGDSASSATWAEVDKSLESMDAGQAGFAILHPPYHDIIKFSEREEDLSNLSSADEFVEKFKVVAGNALARLGKGRFCAVIIGDKYEGAAVTPLGFMCMSAVMSLGPSLKGIIVKDINGNERGKGRTGNLWRYRALKYGFYIFKHEYIFVFKK